MVASWLFPSSGSYWSNFMFESNSMSCHTVAIWLSTVDQGIYSEKPNFYCELMGWCVHRFDIYGLSYASSLIFFSNGAPKCIVCIRIVNCQDSAKIAMPPAVTSSKKKTIEEKLTTQQQPFHLPKVNKRPSLSSPRPSSLSPSNWHRSAS
jgi:hypothetical protein